MTEVDEPPLVDLGEMLRDSPPWLVSAIVHMVVMIVFGLMFVHAKNNQDLLLDAGYSEDFGDPIDEDIDISQDEFQVDDTVLTADNLPIVDDPLATPERRRGRAERRAAARARWCRRRSASRSPAASRA